ncbi:MAG: hypothetical protein UV57_C0025G0008 [Parcubacteria group bacterium GW2011_GWD2_43_10]|uniref:Transcriptional repressor PaaX-like central Cas2-like domain-containing protein n=4 Tax=Candidatus Vebleniibacteriota TaxID=1817921 RepID=A0A1G2Q7F6_9BACT|nr:MAG: hypothetical protein UV47_C0030G0008 [Parcubacteria group bacterium GW2011_GWA2_42_80]KKS83064.1 MAG: hypothetical protein UV57_C0025G0008 [Parcubacteria group bacterium GW2011_GWD2_43_10]KKS93739.1 MAG: hypothetical protein UV69_C0004G0002 [Parcubacteria group bacterium GW2011_GWE2_43_12]KKT14343.1 MAG: hypothetical protein UV92_C0001G0024 [Parcubacteria group bacterium GW2011_GWA1_43_27]KKT16143.1 MAG: hypothetical protein UV96_C0002G0022 [Parcubacteria group bacterium GW2011_GWF2_43_
MNKRSSQPLTKVILALIRDLGESVVDFGKLWSAIASRYGSAYGRGGRGYVAELKKIHNQAELRRKLSELQRRKYIDIHRVGNKFSLELTEKGRSYNQARTWRESLPHRKGWFTVVVFDIPEQMSVERRLWRKMLKVGGFKKLQQSVWVSQLNSYDVVANFIRSAKVGKWVNVYQATDFLISPK